MDTVVAMSIASATVVAAIAFVVDWMRKQELQLGSLKLESAEEINAGVTEDFEVEVVAKNIVMGRRLATTRMDMSGRLLGFDLLQTHFEAENPLECHMEILSASASAESRRLTVAIKDSIQNSLLHTDQMY